MRFVVDGYNVTMADPATVRLEAEAQRAALVRRLIARGELLLGRGAIVVVFDGHSDGRTEGASGIDVRYSGSREADDVIVELARPGVTVVTSDGGLRARAEARGARVVPSSAVFEASPAQRRRSRRYPATTAGLPKGANRITEELKRIWLDGDESEE